MKVIKPQKLGLLHRVFENDQRFYFVVSIFLFFPFDEPRRVLSEVSLWKFVGDELTGENGILDEGFSKTTGEVLVTGRCHPPAGKPVEVSFVRVKMGSVDKRLAVLGDRRWKLGVPTNPEPFTEMPVDWAHAFGGPGFDKNPLGKGFAPVEAEGGKVHALPNIEYPDKLVVGPKDRPPPAGLAAYDLTWPQRFAKVGTYDQKWLETRFPGVAADLDPRFFNVAPDDQWTQGYFKNDEVFLVENMHPTQPRIEGRLPGLVARTFIEHTRPGQEPAFREIAMRIDTVRLFPHRERGVAVYRGMIEIGEDDAADVSCLLIACDDAAEPRSPDHYRQVMDTRRQHGQGAIAALREDDLMPPDLATPLTGGDDNDVKDIIPHDRPLQENLERRRQMERDKARAKLEAQGLDPKDFGLDGMDDDPDAPPPAHDIEASLEWGERRLAKLEEQRKELEEKRKQMEAQARADYAARGMDYDKLVAKMKKDSAGPPKFTASGHLERMRDLCRIAREGGAPMPELEAQVADPRYQEELAEQEKRLREGYRQSAQAQHPVEPLSRDQSATIRAELEAAKAAGIPMPDRDFTGADLSELDLSGIQLERAFLESANLTGTNLAGANLAGAVLARTQVVKTNLQGANLRDANFGAAKIAEADLGGADLSGVILSSADISKTSLSGAKLVRAQLFETKFGEGMDLSGVSASKLTVLRVDLRGVRLAGADFSGGTFAELSVEGADFSGANLEKTTFLTCNADRASFRGGKLMGLQIVHGTTAEEADFSEASMPFANLRGTRMPKAKFGRADLTSADFSSADLTGGNFYQAKARGARFTKTDLTDAGMISIDLLGGMMQKAILRGTDLTGANLFRVDLSKVRVDGRTKIGETNMKQARVLPRSKA